jgi:DivIVA domain-containing protein
MIALRGYDMAQVDQLLAQADRASGTDSEALRTSASEELRSACFRQRLRGYDRRQVDREVERLLRDLG